MSVSFPAIGILVIYVAIFAGTWLVFSFLTRNAKPKDAFTARKTVTFGDESAVTANRTASVVSILALFVIWAAFTNSSLLPIHVPGPYVGETSFDYTAENAAGQTATAKVTVNVLADGENEAKPPVAATGNTGFAHDDTVTIQSGRSELIRVQKNDIGGDEPGYKVIKVNGKDITPGESLRVSHANLVMTPKGTLSIEPDKGWQMDAIWLPAPEAIVKRFMIIAKDGYRNSTLWEHVSASLSRVLAGFALGSLFGIPLGYAMGLSSWFRGWFDPIVEFMRPVPPLALIPLVIIWAGIYEGGKIILLFLAALWIMTIAARSGVSNVRISKVYAAYSLGASKAQILWHVIMPNSLPEIFTGARVAMGVCWGTVVAAELVAAERGAGMMIMVASKFQQTDIVIMGIIIIGAIGYGIDILMRLAEKWLVPWKGKG